MALSDSRDITAAPGAPPGMLSRQGPPAWSGQCFHCVRSLDLNNSDGPQLLPPPALLPTRGSDVRVWVEGLPDRRPGEAMAAAGHQGGRSPLGLGDNTRPQQEHF